MRGKVCIYPLDYHLLVDTAALLLRRTAGVPLLQQSHLVQREFGEVAFGPHLHWEMFIGGVQVDPLQWTRQSFP